MAVLPSQTIKVPSSAITWGREPRAARRQPRRRTWLRIFVVRCGLPCDPRVGGHSRNGGMIPRFLRVVRDYFTLGSADCNVKRKPRVRVDTDDTKTMQKQHRHDTEGM